MRRISKTTGFTLTEIMITVAIIALLTAVAIPMLISVKRTANEASAKVNIRTLSKSAEAAMSMRGLYPQTVSELKDYVQSADDFCVDESGSKSLLQGYNFSCMMNASGYTFEATPAVPGTTGIIVYTASTGGALTPL